MPPMSETEESDLLQIVKDIRVESNEWRRQNDEMNAEFRLMWMQETNAIRQRIKSLETIGIDNITMIKKFEKYESEISGATKFGKAIFSFLVGLAVAAGVVWGFLITYFKH